MGFNSGFKGLKLESSWLSIVRFDSKLGIAPLKHVGNDMYDIL